MERKKLKSEILGYFLTSTTGTPPNVLKMITQLLTTIFTGILDTFTLFLGGRGADVTIFTQFLTCFFVFFLDLKNVHESVTCMGSSL